jgi:hypothetical protein
MKLNLLMFVLGILFVIAGYTQQLDTGCKNETEVRIIPRNVYDQLITDSIL